MYGLDNILKSGAELKSISFFLNKWKLFSCFLKKRRKPNSLNFDFFSENKTIIVTF